MKKLIRREPESIELYQGDLPKNLSFGATVSVDTETQGLNPQRDRLCTVQISNGDGICHIVQFKANSYNAPNLKNLLTSSKIRKIFHYARFDIVVLKKYLGVNVAPIFCTKIASKLVRTYTSFHGLRDISRELLKIDLSKEQQSSDWSAEELSHEQLVYAANDVLNLNLLHEKLTDMLNREGRMDLADACFRFLPFRGELDSLGWGEVDIFSHK